jgi:hypothetical protein
LFLFIKDQSAPLRAAQQSGLCDTDFGWWCSFIAPRFARRNRENYCCLRLELFSGAQAKREIPAAPAANSSAPQLQGWRAKQASCVW